MLQILTLVAAAAGLASAYRPGDEICSYASGNSCPLSAIKPSATDGSVLIYPGGKSRCAYDDFRDPATGFTANATYFFQVFPKAERKKLALMLQGGGACIDDATCNFALQCSLAAPLVSTRAQASSVGVLNAADASNPFKDWNIVYVPYCTGDLHVGSRVLEAFESGFEGIFGRPQCLGLKKKMHLNGFENVKSAFDWARANYPEVDELVLGGLSAGSLGAQALAAYTADLFTVTAKNTKFSVLADSYIGVLPANRPAGQVLNFYGGCNSALKLPASVQASCEAKTTQISDLGAAMLQLLPASNWLFINSLGDNTQRLFYQLAKDGILGYPFTNRISADDFFAEVTRIVNVYKAVSDRITTFFVDGTQHQFLNTAAYYNAVSTEGKRMGDVITAWLASIVGGDATPPTTAPTPTPTTVTPTTITPVVTPVTSAPHDAC